jgi:hypothetical protein
VFPHKPPEGPNGVRRGMLGDYELFGSVKTYKMQSPLLGEMELEYNFSKSKKLTSID